MELQSILPHVPKTTLALSEELPPVVSRSFRALVNSKAFEVIRE